ncbi:LPD7 domain-containing protein [Comamonas testosteroni]|jgi:hypothetical protein|uniref:LPD7 domain-containing protein n=1 Tax=Comamonas testosteroni TaxID=285 RepID=UPI0026E9FDDF|nr:LPD7 domain-containing protein [Comamonas testosteroni]
MGSIDVEEMKQLMRQHERAGLPFNPLESEPITGANVDRLQASMDEFGWIDQRFVSAEQASRNGWLIPANANSVHVKERDAKTGAVSDYKLFNASTVLGIPSLESMLQMEDSAFLAMCGQAVPQLVDELAAVEPDFQSMDQEEGVTAEVEIDPGEALEDEEGIEVGPARPKELHQEAISAPSEVSTLTDLFLDEPVSELKHEAGSLNKGIDWSDEPEPLPEEFAVDAPYWLDGLHNYEGLKHAEEINRLISEKKLAQNKEGVENLLATYPDKLKFGLSVVEKESRDKNPVRKANQAEPATLLEGALVRDKEGKYRPKEGGKPILEDKGTSLKLNRKNGKAYEAAMELALAKGWKSIELTGKPSMLGQAWLEAKMKGLEVVNFNPTEKDREALAQRIAERDAALAKEQAPETVVLRPIMDGAGREVMANVTYTVEQQAAKSNAPVAAGKAQQQSSVTRTTTRVNDVVRTEVQQGVVPKGASNVRRNQTLVEQELAEAVAEDKAEEVGGFDMANGGKLIAQGFAPFQNIPGGKSSPFAVLENDAGQKETVWGVDLPRSIQEAGAQIGDTVSLERGERRAVEVEVELPDGSKGFETFNRVTWKTNVLEKAQDVSEVSVKLPAVESGTHIGPVMAIKDGLIGQKTGRDPNKLVWHEISKLQGKVPAIGDMAEIGYSQGLGKVKGPEMQRGVER